MSVGNPDHPATCDCAQCRYASDVATGKFHPTAPSWPKCATCGRGLTECKTTVGGQTVFVCFNTSCNDVTAIVRPADAAPEDARPDEPDFLPNLMRCLLWYWGTTDPDLLKEQWEENAHRAPTRCFDCELAYGSEGWIECVLPNDAWAKISPSGDEGGILCITCIARRLKRLGLETVPVMLCGTEAIRVADQDEAFDRGWKVAEKRIQELERELESAVKPPHTNTDELRALADLGDVGDVNDRVLIRAAADEIDALRGVTPTATPSDIAEWNHARLDACRITGTTADFQENAISPEALAYAESTAPLGDPLE